MVLKQAVLSIFLLCLAVSVQAGQECKLPPGVDRLAKCTCSKEVEYRLEMALKCDDIYTEELYKVFDQLHPSGDNFHELVVSNSDLSGWSQLPDHMHNLKILKLIKVTGLNLDALQTLLHPLDDLTELFIDEVLNLETLTGEFIGKKKALEVLSLSNNKIMQVQDNSFDVLTDLRELILENNKLQSVPETAIKQKDMKLKLNGNPIKYVSDDVTKKIDENNIQISLDSLECSCDTKDDSFIKYTREEQLDAVKCAAKDGNEGQLLKHMKEEQFCNSTPPIFPSLLLVITLFFFCINRL